MLHPWKWITCKRQERHPLRWRHNGHDSVSNHQPHHCLLSRLFRRRSKQNIKAPRVTGLCAGNSPGTGEFPAQMASNAENVSIWWRHHELSRNQAIKKQHADFVVSGIPGIILDSIQYIESNMVLALLCFVNPYSSGLLCGTGTIEETLKNMGK